MAQQKRSFHGLRLVVADLMIVVESKWNALFSFIGGESARSFQHTPGCERAWFNQRVWQSGAAVDGLGIIKAFAACLLPLTSATTLLTDVVAARNSTLTTLLDIL